MATAVVMPKLGLLMTAGTVVRWLVADGQPVEPGRPIANIMTKKITYQVVAPVGGVLHHQAKTDEPVQIGEPIAVITAPGEAPPPARLSSPGAGAAPEGRAALPASAAAPSAATAFILASPWARHLAHELGLDLSQMTGTGPGGCVIGRDVLRFSEAHRPAVDLRRPAVAPADFQPGRVIPFSGMRRVIAQRMTESLRTTAQATLNAEADITDLLRRRRQAGLRPNPTHADLVIRAAALALKSHPRLNAILLGDEIELLEDIHIGFSVPLPDGLLVPVIRNADHRPASAIAQESRRLARAARAGRLTVDDVTGGTFTVTDLGVYGVDFFVPIINPPEVAILGLGRVANKLALHQGRRVVRARLMLCLAFDHRVVDGAPAAAFLRTLTRLLARPDELLT